mgnify:FL=1
MKKQSRHRFYLVPNTGFVRKAPGRLAGGFGMVKDRDEAGIA